MLVRTHILRFLGPETILCRAFGLFELRDHLLSCFGKFLGLFLWWVIKMRALLFGIHTRAFDFLTLPDGMFRQKLVLGPAPEVLHLH